MLYVFVRINRKAIFKKSLKSHLVTRGSWEKASQIPNSISSLINSFFTELTSQLMFFAQQQPNYDYICEYENNQTANKSSYFDGYSTCSSENGEDSTVLNKYKTEPCKNYSLLGFCSYGDKCQFAHGDYEINPAFCNNLYKTKKCKNFWKKGFCLYGIRCQFLHSECQVRHSQ
jgi:hypothetical protein